MSRARLSAIIGNFLEHYDTALFGFVAPFIAPLFFPESTPLTALILTYGMLPLGIVTRPLGALFFGWIGDKYGRRQALFYSLLGMAMVTMGMGSLPFYPLLLALGRMLQSFCAAGESIGGAIFVLENTKATKRDLMSSLYDVSSIGGILTASLLVSTLSRLGSFETSWRILFWCGGLTALLGFFLRLGIKDTPECLITQETPPPFSLKEKSYLLLPIIFASGFSYVTYSLAFTLMNGYIPLITPFLREEVIEANTGLLVLDLLLLPCFGYLAQRIGKEKVMLFGTVGAVLGAIPLFASLSGASLGTIFLVRLLLIVCGVAFAAPYHSWSLERVPLEYRYRVLSLGSALGSQLIGAPATVICLGLYQLTGWHGAPSLYLIATGLLASVTIYQNKGLFKRPAEGY
ncbi:MAG: MFS transporter [Simkaniaceae bacterium]|nr:MFS transporter [Simkaniaceae bacterium]